MKRDALSQCCTALPTGTSLLQLATITGVQAFDAIAASRGQPAAQPTDDAIAASRGQPATHPTDDDIAEAEAVLAVGGGDATAVI